MATRYTSALRIRVSDFSGKELIIGKNSRVTTSRTEGRVYQFVKSHFQQARVSDTAFASILPAKTLTMWNLCLIWYDFRNAMVHFGGFDPADSRQRHLSKAAGAYSEITSGSNAWTISSDPYLDALKETSKIVLSRQLNLLP